MDIKVEPVDKEYNTESQSVKETWFEVPIESSGAQENFKNVSEPINSNDDLNHPNIKMENTKSDVVVKQEVAEDDVEQSHTKVEEIFKDESITSNDVKSFDGETCDDKTLEVSQRMVYDAGFEKPDVGCSYSDRGPPNKFDSSIQANVKRETSPSPICSAANLSLPYREIDTIKNNVKEEESNREAVAIILLERRTFHKRNFACAFCFDIFSSERLLKHHNLGHCHETKNTQVSNGCEKSLIDGNDVQQPGLKPFKCDQCSFSTVKMSRLKRHKLVHSREKSFKCDQCIFETVYSSRLKYHKMIHSGRKPFECDECSFSAVQLVHLKRHKLIHSGEKPFKCDQCSFITARSSCLKDHKMTHSEYKPLQCDQCSFSAKKLSNLKQHKLIHSVEKPFKCDQCGFSAKQLSSLKQHKLKHSVEKPFKCTQCTYTTVNPSHLKDHESVHSELKPFECDQCSYKSARLSYLKRHKNTHSGKK